MPLLMYHMPIVFALELRNNADAPLPYFINLHCSLHRERSNNRLG